MTQEAIGFPEAGASVDDGKISMELAQSLMQELATVKTQLQAMRRGHQATLDILHNAQRELEDIPGLQCQVSALQTQLKEKEAELKDTRALLGQTTVEFPRPQQVSSLNIL